jgi:hypothetical protein
MQMIDVLKKLQEIEDRSPEVALAIGNVVRMNNEKAVNEAVAVNLNGSDAILGQILKLAGMLGAQTNIDLAAGPTTVGGPAAANIPGVAAAPMSMGGAPMGGAEPPIDGVAIELPSEPGMEPGLPGELGMPDDMSMGGEEPDAGAVGAVEAEGNRPYPNSPHEKVMGPKASVPNGNDLNRSKMTAPKVAGGDNPMHVAVTFD